jgi:hypothetical protein
MKPAPGRLKYPRSSHPKAAAFRAGKAVHSTGGYFSASPLLAH